MAHGAVPHGVYWKDGMKLGYQDVGSWTLMKSTPDDRAKAAWLYAQFVTSKTVDREESHVGLTLHPRVGHQFATRA
jgi:glycerol transport system substrate-binding protein